MDLPKWYLEGRFDIFYGVDEPQNRSTTSPVDCHWIAEPQGLTDTKKRKRQHKLLIRERCVDQSDRSIG